MNWFWNRPSPRDELTRLRRELSMAWFAKAASAGSPRGLTWLSYTDNGDVVWAKHAGDWLALVPVVVQFEPIAGEVLEDVPQAREPRAVVAVFRWRRRIWTSDGRAIFNLTPLQLIDRSAGSWVRV